MDIEKTIHELEDELDRKDYQEAMEEYREDNRTYSIDEVEKYLSL